uniref:Interleukin n=1 Tax=Monopterus albus TaxID=43700 RepID=A0A3Q3JNQ9_MONAL
MEQNCRIVLWMLLLIGILQANPIGIRKTPDFQIQDLGFDHLQEDVSCLKHLSHTQEECIATALDCVVRELKGTVKLECEDPKDYIDSEVDHWNYILDDANDKIASSECACEKWPETPFNEFLEKMESLLQLHSVQKHALVYR